MPYQIPSGYYDQLAQVESGGNPFAKASTSSASGLFQFVRGTWEGLGFNWGNVFDTGQQYQAVDMFTQQNAGVLSSAGIPITEESLYAAHFLGPGTARNVLGAPHDAPVSGYVSQSAINANQSILGGGQTVGGFWDWLSSKFPGGTEPPSPGYSSHMEGVPDAGSDWSIGGVLSDSISNNVMLNPWGVAGKTMTALGDPFGIKEAADNLVAGTQETIADAGRKLFDVLSDVVIRGGYIVLGIILFTVGIIALTKTGGDFYTGLREGIKEGQD